MLDKIYRSHKSACLIKGITIQSIRKIFAYVVLFDNNVSFLSRSTRAIRDIGRKNYLLFNN